MKALQTTRLGAGLAAALISLFTVAAQAADSGAAVAAPQLVVLQPTATLPAPVSSASNEQAAPVTKGNKGIKKSKKKTANK